MNFDRDEGSACRNIEPVGCVFGLKSKRRGGLEVTGVNKGQ